MINSFKGVRDGLKNEEAFRVEIILSLLLTPVAFWLATNYLQLILLIGTLIGVLIVELLNTGIEAAVDRVGFEFIELSGRAKDAGSAAVLLSLVLAGVIWGTIIWQNLF